MKLRELSSVLECSKYKFIDININNIQLDSRNVTNGDLYICIDGFKLDGHLFAASAVKNGAVALITQKELPELDVPQLIVKNSRSAMARCAKLFNNNSVDSLKVIGITGTNGKTTTSHMIKQILELNKIKSAAMGTLGTFVGNKEYPQSLTTPDPLQLHELFSIIKDSDCEIVVMEVSAHALELDKLDGVKFAASVFTNLTQDHLDDFITMDKYTNAKSKLFLDNMSDCSIINIDDDSSDRIIDGFNKEIIKYSTKKKCDVYASDIKLSMTNTKFKLNIFDEQYDIKINLAGKFNVYNTLAAVAVCIKLGLSNQEIVTGIMGIRNIDGRMESVDIDCDFNVIVDYAHTPDSLENLLISINGFCENRCICVFGCGGNRDTTKRPMMGEIAGKLCDYAIITSDNPRTEEPSSIVDMIEVGMKKTQCEYDVIVDRKEAIHKALSMAKKDDVIVIAGKGHETYQDIMGEKHHFDDREIVIEYIDKNME